MTHQQMYDDMENITTNYYYHGYYVDDENYSNINITPYDLDNHLDYKDYYRELLSNLTQDHFLPDPLPPSWQHVLCFFYAVIIALATIGNVIVILVIAKNAKLQTVTNCFLFSLAISDLFIALLNMPFTLLAYMKNEWLLGKFWCKFSHYLQAVFIVSTILTLTIVSIDRYYAILFPLKARHIHTKTRSVVVIATIWVTSLIAVSPQVPIQRLRVFLVLSPHEIRSAFLCVEYIGSTHMKIAYTVGLFIILYALPVVVMVFAYGSIVIHLCKRQPIGEMAGSLKERRRNQAENKAIASMLIIIVLCFILAWLPFFSCQIYFMFHKHNSDSRLIFAVFLLIGYSNSCVNPIIYSLLNDNFRACTKNLLLQPCKSGGLRLSRSRQKLSNRQSSTSTKAVLYSETTNL